MNLRFNKTTLSALIGLALATPLSTNAADPAVWSDRAAAKDIAAGHDELMESVLAGQDIAEIRSKLESLGYQITAVNESETDYVEYEVVKAPHSYEVQIDLDEGTQKANNVDVAPNLWRADSTKAAMRGDDFEVVMTKDYSDRMFVQDWTNEKDALEQKLGVGQPRDFYRAKLEELGYQVTALNEAEEDYLEYEIVSGRNSYEVQIDFEGGNASKVDVTTNVWEAEGTERALGQE